MKNHQEYRAPKVSIVMSTHNDAAYIKYAIESVLQQTFSDWEFIIMNDKSTDNTEEIIKRYCNMDKRLKYFKNVTNIGQTKSLNKGIKLAKGKFIARIDSDDIWTYEKKLKEQVSFLENHQEYGLVGSFWNIINEKNQNLSKITYPYSDENLRKYILIENCFVHSSVLIRKSILNLVGDYNFKCDWAQDYDLWLRIGKVSKLYNIPKFMVDYRINPKGMTQSNYKKQLQDTYTVVKQYKQDYPNFLKGYLLWHLRAYVPKRLKVKVSNILKTGK